MKQIPIAGMIALCASACSSTQGQSTQAVEVEVVELATIMNTAEPVPLQGGLALDGVRAEGHVLVLKISGVESWRPHVSDAVAGKLLGAEFCDGAGTRRLIAEGAQIRVDARTPGGEELAPLPICVS